MACSHCRRGAQRVPLLPTPSQGLPAAQVQADCPLLEVSIALSLRHTQLGMGFVEGHYPAVPEEELC